MEQLSQNSGFPHDGMACRTRLNAPRRAFFVCFLLRACPNRIEIKKNRALIGAWFKHVPRCFLGSEKIHEKGATPGLFFVFFAEGVSKQNGKKKSTKKKNRALIGAWFKHVPLCFSGSEKIHDLQPIAKIKKVER